MEFANRVALVTGAAQGIGAAVASALSVRGAHVAAVDRNELELKSTAAHMRAAGCRVTAYPADVRERAAVDALVDTIESHLGPIGVLVNVAGVLRVGPVLESTDDDWDAVIGVNLRGVVHVSRAVARVMAPRGRGAIVTIGSNVTGVVRAGMGAYAVSKAGAAMFTKCLGLELAGAGVRCNVVSPGSTDTPMQRSLWTDGRGADAAIDGDPGTYRAGIPLRRLASPDDIAEAVVLLASDRSRHITMQELYVDGGATLRA